MPTAKPTAPRKRNRKCKRRLASSSSSSSDSLSDRVPNKTTIKKAPLKKQATPSSASSSSSPSPSTSSLSTSDSENDNPHVDAGAPAFPPASSAKPQRSQPARAHRSPSPPSPPTDVPPFLPPEGPINRAQDEQAPRNQFKQFWMASVADAFGDDLDQIIKVRASKIPSPFPDPS